MNHFVFVCSQNKLRSPTAEQNIADRDDIEVSSAGTDHDADNLVGLVRLLKANMRCHLPD
ncbi:hypothetical protein [Novosphingobium sp. Gsoil 351]|uniref:hypothetical protein n=1 Tax=Novosphingobium sp. Gsoil 351 TaxID=2675225 RepID=UPI0012B487B9|nr:hypothetical protein [Novosphingobium sp. Gsoil 351]QGN53683.1 hypothetical protein GKE62_03125 [Novosphingobium sp. Gsoil 351]